MSSSLFVVLAGGSNRVRAGRPKGSGTRRRDRRRGVVFAAVGLGVVVSSCSSSDTTIIVAPCGPGTQLSDSGMCVAIGSGGSGGVGGGTGQGGTAGTSGAAAGQGGIGGDASVDVSMEAAAGAGGTTEDVSIPDAVGGSAGSDGAVEAESGPEDSGLSEGVLGDVVDEWPGADPGEDECPTGSMPPLWYNCDDSCGPTTPECAAAMCETYSSDPSFNKVPVITDLSQLPLTIRLPSNPGTHKKCTDDCASSPPVSVAALVIRIEPHYSGLTVKVGAPWKMGTHCYNASKCVDSATVEDCYMILEYGTKCINFFTDDPNAPARNVTIEETPWPGNCPWASDAG